MEMGREREHPKCQIHQRGSRLARWATYSDALPREIPPGGLISKIGHLVNLK